MQAQPLLGLLHMSAKSLQNSPKSRRMIELHQVCDFVRRQIVQDYPGSQNQSP